MSQQEINEWKNRNFPTLTLAQAQLLVTEEVGELSRAILKMEQGIRGTKEEWTNEAYKEMGDVLISLSHVATFFGFDMDQAFKDRWDTISQRDYVSDPKQQGIEES